MIESLPGFRGGVEVSQLITAAIFLVATPLVGWIIYRLVASKVRTMATRTKWGGDDILIGALHDVIIVWMAVAGAFAAVNVLRFQRVEDGPNHPGLRTNIADGIEKLLIAVLILSATWVVARVGTDLIKMYSLRTQGTAQSSSVFIVLTRIVVYVVGLLILLQSYGVSIGPLLGALGVGGLAVALALQDTLSNFFAGLQILATKKVKPGDFVQLENGQEGYVVDIDWRHTSIRQLPNNMILVPNATLASSIVMNYYYPEQEVSVLVQVGVHYDSDLEHVERVTIEVAREVLREVEGGIAEFDPFIRYHTFNDSSIDFTVILRAVEITSQFVLKHEFVKRLKKRYDQEGITIPFPMRTIDWPDAIREGFGARAPDGARAPRSVKQ